MSQEPHNLLGKPYNPLDKKSIAVSIARTVMKQDTQRLSTLEAFPGAGVYVLYYSGPHPLYADVVGVNNTHGTIWPLYVGKGQMSGTSVGGFLRDSQTGRQIFKRLSLHKASLEEASDLNVEDFWYRSLAIEQTFIPLAEAMLVDLFSPVWNAKLTGFGGNTQGVGRKDQQRSAWDTVHPGRNRAKPQRPNKTSKKELERKVQTFIAETKANKSFDLDRLLRRFE